MVSLVRFYLETIKAELPGAWTWVQLLEFRSAEPVLQRDLQSSMNECNTSMDMNIWSVESTLRIGVRRLGLVEWIERHMYARHPRVRPSQAPTARSAGRLLPDRVLSRS